MDFCAATTSCSSQDESDDRRDTTCQRWASVGSGLSNFARLSVSTSSTKHHSFQMRRRRAVPLPRHSARPISINPIGRPSLFPQGTFMPGWPLASNGQVLATMSSARPIYSSRELPSAGIGVARKRWWAWRGDRIAPTRHHRPGGKPISDSGLCVVAAVIIAVHYSPMNSTIFTVSAMSFGRERQPRA